MGLVTIVTSESQSLYKRAVECVHVCVPRTEIVGNGMGIQGFDTKAPCDHTLYMGKRRREIQQQLGTLEISRFLYSKDVCRTDHDFKKTTIHSR